MKKTFLLIALLSLLVIPSFSQVRKEESRPGITLCWGSSLDTAATYLIYFSFYNSPDTSWRLIGSTKEKKFTVAKEGFKGDIAFGVRSVYYNDTSAIHKSLDTNACNSFGNECNTECTSGPWYISWHIERPTSISIW